MGCGLGRPGRIKINLDLSRRNFDRTEKDQKADRMEDWFLATWIPLQSGSIRHWLSCVHPSKPGKESRVIQWEDRSFRTKDDGIVEQEEERWVRATQRGPSFPSSYISFHPSPTSFNLVLESLINTIRSQALVQAGSVVQDKLRGASHAEGGMVLNEDHQVSTLSFIETSTSSNQTQRPLLDLFYRF